MQFQFIPTASLPGEVRKAKVKNLNLPFLQFMYHGDSQIPLHCLITKQAGWVERPDYGTGESKTRFRLDFNHIRQKCNETRVAGISVDKSGTSPSNIFRGRIFDPTYKTTAYNTAERQRQREMDFFEFVCIMPISSEEHSFISQDSAKSHITLKNFHPDTWAWCLQNQENFEKTKQFFGISIFDHIKYDFMIDHLTQIDHESIIRRICESFK